LGLSARSSRFGAWVCNDPMPMVDRRRSLREFAEPLSSSVTPLREAPIGDDAAKPRSPRSLTSFPPA